MIVHEAVQVFYKPLPYSIGGCVTQNEDDSYTIFINSRLSDYKQQEALIEELTHIGLNHFGRDISMQLAEAEASMMATD